MQAAGDRVGLAVELAAGVQGGEDDLDRRALLDRVHVDRDAAAVVAHPHAAVGQQRHVDGVAVAGQRLVHRVVDDLVDQVVQAALAGGADVHARALADRLEALEDRDRAGAVGAGCVRRPRWLSVGAPAAAVRPIGLQGAVGRHARLRFRSARSGAVPASPASVSCTSAVTCSWSEAVRDGAR